MKLSAEQFAELASTFNGVASSGKFDRRRANRMDLNARIKITPIASGQRMEEMNVMACDFSARGVAFLNNTALPAGAQFITELPRRSGGTVQFLCTIMHSEAVGGSMFRIGSEFTCTLQPAPQTSAADDQREMKRIRESMLR